MRFSYCLRIELHSKKCSKKSSKLRLFWKKIWYLSRCLRCSLRNLKPCRTKMHWTVVMFYSQHNIKDQVIVFSYLINIETSQFLKGELISHFWSMHISRQKYLSISKLYVSQNVNIWSLLQLSVTMMSWVRVWVDLILFTFQFFDKVLRQSE